MAVNSSKYLHRASISFPSHGLNSLVLVFFLLSFVGLVKIKGIILMQNKRQIWLPSDNTEQSWHFVDSSSHLPAITKSSTFTGAPVTVCPFDIKYF